MRARQALAAVLIFGAMGLVAAVAAAQQATLGAPYHSVGDSYFERMGTSWGFNLHGVSARFGGGLGAPPFGRFDPSAGLNGGLNLRGPAGNGFFNFGMAQGFGRSLVSQSPSVTVLNGQTGYIGDVSQSPFVVGYVPVVAGMPLMGPWSPTLAPPSYLIEPVDNEEFAADPGTGPVEALRRRLGKAAAPVARAAKALPPPPEPGPMQRAGVEDGNGLPAPRAGRSSSAAQAVPSVAEARRLYELEQQSENAEAQSLLDRGVAAEKAGKPNVAKIYYRRAAAHATGELRQQALGRLESLDGNARP